VYQGVEAYPRWGPASALIHTLIRGSRVTMRQMDYSPEVQPQPAEYLRRKAVQARQQAKELTTPAIKARLLDLAFHYDQLADRAEQAAEEPSTGSGPRSHDGLLG
jgi:hypothetical protein